jgi:hypothetical protein
MRGLMMDRPLLVSALLEHAGEYHGSTEIAARDFDGTIFRYDYAAALVRAKQLAQAIGALGIAPGERVGTLATASRAPVPCSTPSIPACTAINFSTSSNTAKIPGCSANSRPCRWWRASHRT